MASKMSAFTNLENAFTIFIDIFLFNYAFVATDIIGMGIILACILTPVILKLIEKPVAQVSEPKAV